MKVSKHFALFFVTPFPGAPQPVFFRYHAGLALFTNFLTPTGVSDDFTEESWHASLGKFFYSF